MGLPLTLTMGSKRDTAGAVDGLGAMIVEKTRHVVYGLTARWLDTEDAWYSTKLNEITTTAGHLP